MVAENQVSPEATLHQNLPPVGASKLIPQKPNAVLSFSKAWVQLSDHMKITLPKIKL